MSHPKLNQAGKDPVQLTVKSASTGVLLVLAVVLPHGVNSKSDLIPVTHTHTLAGRECYRDVDVNVCVCNYCVADEIIILSAAHSK